MDKPKILISIHPEWCEKIFNGEKTIEVRKTAPKIEPPFEVLVYMTATKERFPLWEYVTAYKLGDKIVDGSQKVIGSFVCDSVDEYDYHRGIMHFGGELGLPIGTIDTYFIFEDDYKAMCLSYDEVKTYGKGKTLHGWHITEPKLFDRPRKLSEFGTICDKLDNDKCDNCSYLRDDDAVFTWCGVDNIKPITRAPQSWMYVEEIS